MFMFLAKMISSNAHHKSPRYLHQLLSRFFFASSTQNPDLQTPRFVVADHLVTSFGFSLDKAARISKSIAHLKSPEKPDSVRRFLEEHGFSEADIRKLIIGRPSLLSSCPEKTLRPNLRTLRDMGLSTSALNMIILSNPTALLRDSSVSRITFWMDFFGGNESAVVKALTQNRGLLTHDINSSIAPKISLLQSHGFSNQEIARIVSTIAQFITSNTSRMEDMLKRTEELGFQPGSGVFLRGLETMVCNTRDALQRKMNLLISFGWSEEEFLFALRKAPGFVNITEKNLQDKMEFLIGEARCDPSYTAGHPMLVNYSLEKRLRPRINVLHLLETKGLCQKQRVLYTAICMPNIDFVKKYILPHKEIIPELQEAFTVACDLGSGSTFLKLK